MARAIGLRRHPCLFFVSRTHTLALDIDAVAAAAADALGNVHLNSVVLEDLGSPRVAVRGARSVSRPIEAGGNPPRCVEGDGRRGFVLGCLRMFSAKAGDAHPAPPVRTS